jgi:undecaprenyl pyrophosphate phosphatase UppP
MIARSALVFSLSVLAWILSAHVAGAQTFVPLAPAPGGTMLGELYGTTSLAGFINKLFTIMIAVGAIVAVLRIAFAGYLYMATDAWHTKGKAKEIIGDVIIGILLLLSIWLILRQINPDLLNLDVLRNIPKTN